MRVSVFYLLVLTLCASAQAGMRIWEDKEGRLYEAELVRELFGKVTLRDTAGNEHRLDVEELSAHDQKYLRVRVPPVVDVDFSRKFYIKPKPVELSDDDSDTVKILRGDVSIRKVSKRPFTSRLNAEVYLIGEEVDGDNYILFSRTESSFLFTADNLHKFKTDETESVIYTEYTGQRRGGVYLGYLVAVSDAQGRIVYVKTDIDWLADKVEKLRELYLRGAASKYSRHFDKKNVQKTEVPRPRYYPSRIR